MIDFEMARTMAGDGAQTGVSPAAGEDDPVKQVYAELKRLAAHYLEGERIGHTLQPTALVHEAYLRLADCRRTWKRREEFIALAASVMRRVLVDHARARRAVKRGRGMGRVTLDGAVIEAGTGSALSKVDLIALDDAMARLGGLDARQAKIVELKFFGGLSAEEAAGVMGVSTRTVEREWRMARAWLKRELGSAPGPSGADAP